MPITKLTLVQCQKPILVKAEIQDTIDLLKSKGIQKKKNAVF